MRDHTKISYPLKRSNFNHDFSEKHKKSANFIFPRSKPQIGGAGLDSAAWLKHETHKQFYA